MLTAQETEQIVREVLERITSSSKSLDDLLTIEDIDSAESLPVYLKNTKTLGKLPIETIKSGSQEAANKANIAADNANIAAVKAQEAIDSMQDNIEASKELPLIYYTPYDISTEDTLAEELMQSNASNYKEVVKRGMAVMRPVDNASVPLDVQYFAVYNQDGTLSMFKPETISVSTVATFSPNPVQLKEKKPTELVGAPILYISTKGGLPQAYKNENLRVRRSLNGVGGFFVLREVSEQGALIYREYIFNQSIHASDFYSINYQQIRRYHMSDDGDLRDAQGSFLIETPVEDITGFIKYDGSSYKVVHPKDVELLPILHVTIPGIGLTQEERQSNMDNWELARKRGVVKVVKHLANYPINSVGIVVEQNNQVSVVTLPEPYYSDTFDICQQTVGDDNQPTGLLLKLRSLGVRGTDFTTLSQKVQDQETKITEAQESLQNHLENDTPGLNHVPSGGKEGQFLTFDSNGKARWADQGEFLKSIEDLTSYGIEWDMNQADPHVKRIGNLQMHRDLPIQSKMRGCIAQGGRIIYYLDEDNWYFKYGWSKMSYRIMIESANPSIIVITTNSSQAQLDSLLDQKIKILKSQDIDMWRFTDEVTLSRSNKLSQTADTIKFDTGVSGLAESLGLQEDTYYVAYFSKDMSRLDGYDGTVRVHIPEFYYRGVQDGTVRRLYITQIKQGSGWNHVPSFLIDAQQATKLHTEATDMGYLSTLPQNAAVSVLNTSTYCRGGVNDANWDHWLEENQPIRSMLNKGLGGIGLPQMRACARLSSAEVLSYSQYKALYWLYMVEYANFNSQEAFTEELTPEGYRQGGMGYGVQNNSSVINWSNFNRNTAFTPSSMLVQYGNHSVAGQFTLNTEDNHVDYFPFRWRGILNLHGDIWARVEGLICIRRGDYIEHYECTDPAYYGETLTEHYKLISTGTASQGNIKNFTFGNRADITVAKVEGNNTIFKCDNHWTMSQNNVLCGSWFGGHASDGAAAGLGYFLCSGTVGTAWGDTGFYTASLYREN